MVPLYLEARIPTGRWNHARFRAFQEELQAHASRICHLSISAERSHLHKIVEELVSPAPTLEYLSLSSEREKISLSQASALDTLFGGASPKLSCIELQNCAISWKSPLLKRLRYLDIRTPPADARPSLSDWLNALDVMPQLKTLTLHSASPIAPPDASLPFDVEYTITLPSLTHLNISATARECGLALAHLELPALTQLGLRAISCRSDGSDVHEILPYFSQHAHGLQHAQQLQGVVDRSDRVSTEMLVWTLPDIDFKVSNPITFPDSMLSAPLTISFTNEFWSAWFPGTHTEVHNATMAALPLDGIVSLSSHNRMCPLDKQRWYRHAPRWPLLQRLCLGLSAASGLREMLLEDNGGRERPILPSLTKIVLVESALSARRTLRLCDAFMKRVEQGVPLETLDLRTCFATGRAVELLSEIVVEVLGPDDPHAQVGFAWDSATRGLFVGDDSSEFEGYDESDPGTGSDDEVAGNDWGIDVDGEYYAYDDGEDDHWDDYW